MLTKAPPIIATVSLKSVNTNIPKRTGKFYLSKDKNFFQNEGRQRLQKSLQGTRLKCKYA